MTSTTILTRRPRRRRDRRLVTGYPGDFATYPDRNLNGSRGQGWHFDVMGGTTFHSGWRFTKAGAIFAGWRHARRAARSST